MMRKLLMGMAASAALLAASAANAAINVSLWLDQAAVAENANLSDVSVANLGAADATLTLPLLDFSTGDSEGTTIDEFLGSSLGGAVGGHALNNTVFLFTGTLFLNAGINSFVVPHDDGLQLNIDGFGLVVDAPGPTGEDDTPFSVNAATAGAYAFQMSYGECCGGPAVIRFLINDTPVTGGVPEPATWGLMLVGFGGLGAAIRRRRVLAMA